jgi:hypothetical protein
MLQARVDASADNNLDNNADRRRQTPMEPNLEFFWILKATADVEIRRWTECLTLSR